MTSEDLTDHEINILLDAIDLWDNESKSAYLVVNTLANMVSNNTDSEVIRAKNNALKRANDQMEVRRDTSIFLRAKLLKLKQENAIKKMEKQQ